jgi:hypothetical protein
MSPAKPNPDRDERLKLPLDPETALRALLAVDPEDEPTGGKQEPEAATGQGTSEAGHGRSPRKPRGKAQGLGRQAAA